MNKIAEPNSNLNSKQDLYIPLEEFHERVSTIKDNYYESTLRFTPVFENFKARQKESAKNFPKINKAI